MTTPRLLASSMLLAAALARPGARAAELRGQIVGDGGKPVAHAVIRVLPDSPASAKSAKAVRVETGADGSFIAAGLTGETFRIRVEAKGYAPLTQPQIPGGASLNLHVKTGSKVSGIVRDRATQAPLAGATVLAWDKDAETFGEDAYRKATTGKDGRFVAEDLPAAKVTVEAKAQGHATARSTNVALPKADLELLLDIAGVLNGTVRTAVGDPVSGAEVEATLQGGKHRSAKSGPDGRYRMTDASFDLVETMKAKAPKFVLSVREGPAPSDGIVDFVLDHLGSIGGTVHGYDGKVPASFHVKVHGQKGAKAFGKTSVEHDFNDPSGAFKLDEIEPGTYTIEIAADRYGTVTKQDFDVVPEKVSDAGTITLQSKSVLRGRVVGRDHTTPVAGASVHLTLVDAPAGGTTSNGSWSGTSAADGTFTTSSLPDGTFDVAADQPQYAPVRTRVTFHPDADTPELVIEMFRGGTLTGSVVDAKTEPVPGVHIVASQQGAEGDSRTADTGSDGHYFIDGLAPGTWTVMRQQDRPTGSAAIDTKYATIQEGQTTEIDFDERPRVNVTGLVLKGDTPIPNASVYFVSIDGTAAHDGKSAQADASGAYQIGLMHGGKFQVSVVFTGPTNQSGHNVVTLNIPDQTDVRQDIVFTVHAIAGRVVDPDRNGVKGAQVTALRDGAMPGDAPRQATSTSAADGSFHIDAVDPGTYRVSAKAKSFTAADEYPVLVSDDQNDPDLELVLQRGWIMKGHLVDPQGRGVPGALVVVAPTGAAESGYLPTQTDGTGAFKITAPSDGPVNVAAIPANYAPAVQNDVEQPAEGDSDVVLHATPGGSLRIRCVRRNGDPAGGVQLAYQASPLFPGSDVVADRNRPSPTGADGMTLLQRLYPGSYMISVPGRRDVPAVQAIVNEGGESDATIEVP